ncbi:MAG: hypothetical protein ACK5ZC_18440 [Pirellulaceae bacterium]
MIDPRWKGWLQGLWEQDPQGEPHGAIVFRAVPVEESLSPRPDGGAGRRERPHVAMELKAGDQLVWHSVSRGDQPSCSHGTWRLVEGTHTTLELNLEGAPPRNLEILQLDDQRLVLGPTDA